MRRLYFAAVDAEHREEGQNMKQETERETVLRKMLSVSFVFLFIGIISGLIWMFKTLPLWQFSLGCIGIAITIIVAVFVVLTIKVAYKMRHSKEE